MTVYNFGSINADYFPQAPHILALGETLAAMMFERGLGGKGPCNTNEKLHRIAGIT